jgi:UDP-N-acetylmuramyl pentapeptide phosphotransferase/UDP-N-acetylglucosamine-1-phosphate transferase
LYQIFIVIMMGFSTCFLSLPSIMGFMRSRGIAGRDVHKKDRPIVPEMGGIAMLLGLAVSTMAGVILLSGQAELLISFFFTALIAGVIGAIDDLRPLNAKIKPFLTTLACIPILVLGTYTPNIVFPLIGGTRLTIVYPFLVPIVMAVTSNAVNMMDPFNGVMSGTSMVIALTLLVSAIIVRSVDAILLCGILLGVLLPFFYFNRYPSRVFSGDVGSLSVGAALGAIAIMGRLEVVAVVAFMPQIMNAFYGLSTIGRLYERREVARPIEVLDDGRLMARSDPEAPLTLARFVLARGPLRENEAALVFVTLSAISSLLALITTYLIVVTT